MKDALQELGNLTASSHNSGATKLSARRDDREGATVYLR